MSLARSQFLSRPWVIELLLVVATVGISLVLWQGDEPEDRTEMEVFATDRVWGAMSEMERVGLATFSWLTDQVGANLKQNVQNAVCAGGLLDMADYPPITHQDLKQLLVPGYIAFLPEIDPWGNPYDYRLNLANLLSPNLMAIRTAGADGTFAGNPYEVGFTSGPSEDLIWADGFFVREVPQIGAGARQDRSFEDIRNLGVAWMSWLTDNLFAARAALDVATPVPTVDLSTLIQVSHAELVDMLIPSASFFYIRCVPELDAWGNPYEFFLNDNLFAQHVLALRSAGADGLFEGDVYFANTFPGDDFERDLVWADGLSVQSPDGHQLIFADDFESGDLWGTWSCTE